MARTTDISSNSLKVRPMCFLAVSGLVHRATPEAPPVTYVNDALFMPALPPVLSDPDFQQKTLVFFGGDVQNFLNKMDTSDPKINVHLWCLEAAAQRLGSYFPSHHIVVIKPSRTMFEHVSCFDNFVYSNYVGSPTYAYHYKGLMHLERLLFKISKKIRHTDSDELFKMLLKIEEDEEEGADDDDPTGNIVWQYEVMPKKRKTALVCWQKDLHLEKYPLTLVAFSKGCVVLNQFLHEFHYARALERKSVTLDSSFIDRIEHMYWLDCGHPGRFDVYPTSRGALNTIATLGIQIHVHLSQYQMDDYLRPWIRRQCNEFIEVLRSSNAKLVVYKHISEHVDLRAHWNVFLNFMQKESEPAPPHAPDAAPPAPAGPRAPSPPAAPHGPQRHPNTPQERALMNCEILGLALVSPNDAPDLSLQLIFRRPLDDIMTAPTGSVQPSTSGARNGPAQSSSDPGEGPSARGRAPEPSAPSGPERPPGIESADGYKVLLKKESKRINFSRNPEALEAFESAKYYKLESPSLATVVENENTISFNIYTAVKEHYKPMILDWKRRGDVDSGSGTALAGASAGGGRSEAAVPSASRGAPRRNARASNPRHAVAETPSVSRQADRIPQTVESSSPSERSQATAGSDSSPRAGRRSRRVPRDDTPYSRGTNRYNLRSAR